MRVIWISLVIFIAAFAIAFGLHDPDAGAQLSAAGESKPAIENPFVEDKAADEQVNLAALPQNQQSNIKQEDLNTPANVVDNIADPAVVEPMQNQDITSSSQTAAENPGDGKTAAIQNAGSQNEVAAAENSGEQSDATPIKKPLGLLARSAEQRRNVNKVAVIVHQENDQPLTPQEIRAMYTDRVTHWKDGSKVMLYNLPLGDKHREKFSQRVLNMSALQADEEESIRRDNNAAINPVRVKAKNIVVSYVERNPNAIAYVPLSLIRDKSNVKVIMTLNDD